jgi:2-polyprenyl-3-methyl-5-hydroxy-6-metoxy-1,4-benzoquinol methylase
LSLVPATAGRILDLGCASGYLGQELVRSRGCAVWGIDTDPDSVAAARQAGYEDVVCADLDQLSELPWRGPFDAVLAGDVLEHLKRPDALLARIRTVLTPDAPVIVSLPNIGNVTIRLNLLRGRFDYKDTGILDRTHVRLYTYKTARELLVGSGFAVEGEYAGSSRLGVFLNGGLPGARRLRPLLAYTIILKVTAA